MLSLLPVHRASPRLPASHVVNRGPQIRLAPEPGREGDVVEVDVVAAAELGERTELVQLQEAVEPVAARRVRCGTTSPADSR